MKSLLTTGQRVQHKVNRKYGIVVDCTEYDNSRNIVSVEYPDYPKDSGPYLYFSNYLDAID